VFLNGIGGSRKGQKMYKMTQEEGCRKRKGQMHIWTVRTVVRSNGRLVVRLIAEEGYGNIC
jgi:hypothetical protein